MKRMTALAIATMMALGLSAPATGAPVGLKKITSCQTIGQSGSYSLGNNLTAAGSCLVVAADFVTIDLAGFTIAGNGTGGGVTSDTADTPRKGIALRNGTIRNFQRGIDFGCGGYGCGIQILVEQMFVLDNSDTGVSVNEMAVVKDSVFSGNGDGINVGSRSLITGNDSSHNTSSGIVVSTGSTVIGNTAGVNGNNGIVVLNGSTVVNNTVQVNDNFGLAVTCPSNVSGNTATNNGTNLLLQSEGCNNVNNLAP